MVEGTKLCDIYAASKTFLEQKSPALKNSLAKEIGFSVEINMFTKKKKRVLIPLNRRASSSAKSRM